MLSGQLLLLLTLLLTSLSRLTSLYHALHAIPRLAVISATVFHNGVPSAILLLSRNIFWGGLPVQFLIKLSNHSVAYTPLTSAISPVPFQ